MLLRCVFILLIYVAAVLDTSAPLIPGTVSIYWLTLLAIGAIWRLSPAEATLWGALIGFVANAISSGRMGVDLLVFSTLACLLATLRQRWECRSLMSLALMASATAGGPLLAHIGILGLESDRAHLDEAIGSAAATAIAAVLIGAVGRALGSGSIRFHTPVRA
jgi:hypothetical protein